MQEHQLRASIESVGPLLPVLIYGGRVIDGEKRDRICGELGLVARVQTLHGLDQACSALWSLHPARALELAGERPLVELAQLCGVRAVDIAIFTGAQRGGVRVDSRAPRKTRGEKRIKVQFWSDPQFKHYLDEGAAALDVDASALMRAATWEYLQRVLPRAATEGAARGPDASLVRLRPRRRV